VYIKQPCSKRMKSLLRRSHIDAQASDEFSVSRRVPQTIEAEVREPITALYRHNGSYSRGFGGATRCCGKAIDILSYRSCTGPHHDENLEQIC
jgi:hypothetical protein